jgi:multiple sugar transport system substrate-binding protein
VGRAGPFAPPHPRIVVEPVRRPYADHLASLAAAGGDAPDVALDSGPYLDSHRTSRLLLDLSPLAASARLDLGRYWTDSSFRPSDGALAAFPLWVDADVLYYNRDLFAAAKLAEPTDAWTWDEFLATAERLSEGKPGQMTRWGALLVNDIQGGWGSFVASNGGDFLDVAARKTALGGNVASVALRFVRDAIVAHHAAPGPSEQNAVTGAGRSDPFLDGTVAMFPGGSWLMGSVLAGARFSWDVAPLPRAPRTGRASPTFAAQPIVISGATPHPDEAWAFLGYLIGLGAQRAIAKGKARLPALKEVASDPASGYAIPPPARVAVVAASLSSAHDLQFLPGWGAWRSAVVAALEPAFDERADFDSALEQAIADGDAALARAPTG